MFHKAITIIVCICGLGVCLLDCSHEEVASEKRGRLTFMHGCKPTSHSPIARKITVSGEPQAKTGKELAMVIKQLALLSLPDVESYNVGLCCYKDPRKQVCLNLVVNETIDWELWATRFNDQLQYVATGFEISIYMNRNLKKNIEQQLQ